MELRRNEGRHSKGQEPRPRCRRVSGNPRKQISRQRSSEERRGLVGSGASNVSNHKSIKYFLNHGRAELRTLAYAIRIWHIGTSSELRNTGVKVMKNNRNQRVLLLPKGCGSMVGEHCGGGGTGPRPVSVRPESGASYGQ